jgi:hypothetical protein
MPKFLLPHYGEVARTTDATAKIIASISIAEKQIVLLDITVFGRQIPLSQNKKGIFKNLVAALRREGGNVIVDDLLETLRRTNDAAWGCIIAANIAKQTVDISVKGNAEQTIVWMCWWSEIRKKF